MTRITRAPGRSTGIEYGHGYLTSLGLAVSASSKVAGTVLVFGYLVIPPAAAMLCCRRLRTVLILAPVIATASTLVGLLASVRYNLPTNAAITATASALFTLAAIGYVVRRTIFR
jgi:ABC-type Mn2+/Zn2+ transport system permease subunit